MTVRLNREQRLDRDWREWLSSAVYLEKTTSLIRNTTVRTWNPLKTTYKVSDFIGWQRDGSLVLNPDFQRRSVWNIKAKSYLIDTIIRGFPIPIIFIRDRKSNLQTLMPLRDVVDGQQRLRTVIAFTAPELLKDFDQERDNFRIRKEHLEEFQGMSFRELPTDVQNRILDYQFSVNVFPSDTDDREVKQIFTRMNSSGYKLNDQELRNAEYFGAFKVRAEKLATEQLNRWRTWRVFSSDNLARMLEVELTSELMILMMDGISEKSDKVITGYYKEFDDEFARGPEIERCFQAVLDAIDKLFSDVIPTLFRKRTMFYALFAAVYNLMFGQQITLFHKKLKAMPLSEHAVEAIKRAGERIEGGTAPKSVLDATTRRTTHVKERKEIVGYLLEKAK